MTDVARDCTGTLHEPHRGVLGRSRSGVVLDGLTDKFSGGLHHRAPDVGSMATSGRWIEQHDDVGFGTLHWMLSAVRVEDHHTSDGTSRQTAGPTVPGSPNAVAQTRCDTVLSLQRDRN